MYSHRGAPTVLALGLGLVAGSGLLAAQGPGPLAGVAVAADSLFEPCTLAPHTGPAVCGTVEVAEDPGRAEGRRIDLRVVVLQATGPDSLRLPDPVFVLDGGPGQAASRSVDWVSRELSVVLERRDVVLVDRRGTGGSNPLDCPAPEPGLSIARELKMDPVEVARSCRAALEVRADLTRYTSPYAADDLDVVRDALGYERINLYGGSYGSREAFEYMRRHGSRLRSAAVFAVTPQHERALLESPATAETAVQRLLDDCMAEAGCRAAYPDVRRQLRTVVRRLEAEPGRFTVALPDGSRSEELALTRERFGGLLRSILLSPAGGAQVPYLIHLAYIGDYDQVGALYVRLSRGLAGGVARGLFLSVVCAEEMARTSAAEIGPAADGTFWGAGWPRSIRAQCEAWPPGDLPPDWATAPRGDTPFLFLSGWLDPIAPPAWAGELTRWMPNARRVIVREGHHSFPLDDCGRRTLARFYDTADPFDLDAACIASTPRPAFLVPNEGP